MSRPMMVGHHYNTASIIVPQVMVKKVIKLLLAHGASLEEKCILGNTALHEASAKSGVEMIQFLLDLGANIHATTNKNDMPLHFACWKSKADIACKLLDNGADLSARNTNGLTPLEIASSQQVKDIIIAHHFNMTRQLRQEYHDLKKFTLATAFGNMDRAADETCQLRCDLDNANKEIAETNKKLAETNKKLTETNEELTEALGKLLLAETTNKNSTWHWMRPWSFTRA